MSCVRVLVLIACASALRVLDVALNTRSSSHAAAAAAAQIADVMSSSDVGIEALLALAQRAAPDCAHRVCVVCNEYVTTTSQHD
jgi:hypothetical protein